MTIAPVIPFGNSKTSLNNTSTAATNAINNNAPDAKSAKGLSKKNAAIIGGVAALAIAGISAAVVIKKGKMPDEVKEAFIAATKLKDEAVSLAEDVQKQADEIFETAQRKFDEVTELFKKGEEKAADGTVLRKITKETDTQSIMEEFADGKLARKTIFVEDGVQEIFENIEKSADGTEKTAKRLSFFKGEILDYSKNIEKSADGTVITEKAMRFDFHNKGKISNYAENMEKSADGTNKAAKHLIFDDGKISEYRTNLEYSAGHIEAAKYLNFDKGKISQYEESAKLHSDGCLITVKELYCENGKPSRLIVNYKYGLVMEEYNKEGIFWKKADPDDGFDEEFADEFFDEQEE